MNPAIEALLNDDPNAFREAISDTLMDKLGDRLELARADIAADLFGEPASGAEDFSADMEIPSEGEDTADV